MRPVLATERLVRTQPRILPPFRRQAAQLRARVEVVIRRLPAVTTAAAVDHDPHGAVVDVDLHLDKMIAAADRSQLWRGLVTRARDAIAVEKRIVDGNVLALAEIRTHAKRLGSIAQDLLDLRLAETRHVLRAVT